MEKQELTTNDAKLSPRSLKKPRIKSTMYKERNYYALLIIVAL